MPAPITRVRAVHPRNPFRRWPVSEALNDARPEDVARPISRILNLNGSWIKPVVRQTNCTRDFSSYRWRLVNQ